MLKLKNTVTLILSIILISSSFAFQASADSLKAKDIFLDPNGETMIAARKGYWKYAPENSIKAIDAAEKNGADIIEIDIKKTADGVLILMEDETVERTCTGFGKNTIVTEMTYDEISALRLLEGAGGDKAEATDEKVPSLEEVFKNQRFKAMTDSVFGEADSTLFMLDTSFGIRNEIYNLANEYNMLDNVIFLFSDAKPKEIAEWKSNVSEELMTVAYFKGNVIFAALSFVSDAVEAENEAVYLATSNPYGVVFGETVTEKAIGNTRLMVNTADSTLCGKIRTDTEIWWDDLISRGYSVILTDYVPELRAYIDDCNKKMTALRDVYESTVRNWTLPDIEGDRFYDYKLAYTNAKELAEKCINMQSSSRSDIVTATYNLQKAYDDINQNFDSLEDGTAGMTVTPVRILLCIAAAAAVTAAEIFVYKKKKKI